MTGSIVVNGQEVSLPYVYAVRLEEGFYDPADPAWRVVFVSGPVEERDLDGGLWDVSMLEVLITETAEFDDEPTLQVYAQNLRMPELESGNVSGGTYPSRIRTPRSATSCPRAAASRELPTSPGSRRSTRAISSG